MIFNGDSDEKMSELLQIIENLKVKLIKTGIDKGLTDPNTLQISEQLDTYIVKYQKLVSKNPINKN
ncbi:Spo0E family sporulation regulatory protein-aspartic acid phosphatase [Niallia sp. 01092]|uniref:Spo0E family sporulation regulatory protein-aspartic acid phosphatase n=1 Tax=unclassified Niallia TaxID=2837522 RepID=UPI003FD3CFED